MLCIAATLLASCALLAHLELVQLEHGALRAAEKRICKAEAAAASAAIAAVQQGIPAAIRPGEGAGAIHASLSPLAFEPGATLLASPERTRRARQKEARRQGRGTVKITFLLQARCKCPRHAACRRSTHPHTCAEEAKRKVNTKSTHACIRTGPARRGQHQKARKPACIHTHGLAGQGIAHARVIPTHRVPVAVWARVYARAVHLAAQKLALVGASIRVGLRVAAVEHVSRRPCVGTRTSSRPSRSM